MFAQCFALVQNFDELADRNALLMFGRELAQDVYGNPKTLRHAAAESEYLGASVACPHGQHFYARA